MTTTPDLWRSPFLDNTSLTGNQNQGVVAATAGNEFFAVWVDESINPDDIFARKFDSQGNPLTIPINLTTTVFGGDTFDPAAVRLPIASQGDGLATAFSVDEAGGIGVDVWLIRTNSTLSNFNFTPIAIAPALIEDNPSITPFSDGSVWVAFTSEVTRTQWDILARRVDAAGNLSGPITVFDAPA